MRTIGFIFIGLLLVGTCIAQTAAASSSSSAAADAVPPCKNIQVQKLADSVYAAVRQDPPGFMVNANTTFIINNEDVIVVDTNGSATCARELVAELRKLTDKPVTFVVNTHWHDDHILGNQVFHEAYPHAEFVAHANTRTYLPTKGITARKQMMEGAPNFEKDLKNSLSTNKSIAGGDLTDEERTSLNSDVRLIDQYLADVANTPIVLPTIAVTDQLTLYRGKRIIDIRYLGRGHTSGDIVVHLPQEGILITGDLVIWPVPLVGSDQSHVSDWSTTLDKLRTLHATTIVPGHGPVQHDDAQMKLMSEIYASIAQQTQAAVMRGDTLEQARKSVKIDDLRKEMCGDSRVRRLLFANYVLYPAVESAYTDATQNK
jgi:glyoxylase-like metal-dependent hydrolase (beta-lactamase superfamily II)